MSDKEKAMKVLEEMPDTATLSEIFDAVIVHMSATKGFEDIDNGNSNTQEELLEEMKN